jgi:hypothetical protein
LEGLEDELDDAAEWAGATGTKGYQPELLSKYVDEDFEPMVWALMGSGFRVQGVGFWV